MARDYDNLGHKNLELLRFYINKDITKIEKNLASSNDQMFGCIIASLIDIFIVLMFDDLFSKWCALYKILSIIVLLLLFFVFKWIIEICRGYKKYKAKLSGKQLYDSSDIQEKVDAFDNIACDGLLICQHYMDKYETEDKLYIKDFYIYEIIHHLKKAFSIFKIIYTKKELYVSSSNRELIDEYRVNNFIVFGRMINNFLQDELKLREFSEDVKTDMEKLNSEISKWKEI